jgi:PAS domain S-box-containing protein
MAEELGGTLSEERLRAFVEAVFDAFYDWHVGSVRLEMSSQMDVLLRLSPGELPRTYGAWLARVHPDDRSEALENNLRAVERGDIYDGEYRMCRGDGSVIYVHDRGVVIKGPDGVPSHQIGAIRDITAAHAAAEAQREAAELYSSLFAQAINPAYQIAADGRFLDANRVGLAFLSLDRRQLVRETVTQLWGEQAQAAVSEALSEAHRVVAIDLELVVAESQKALALTLVPGIVAGQRICFALGTDVTAHRSLSWALEASQESLQRQAQALEDANTALRVILEQRNRDRRELEHTIVANAETLIVPLLQTLRRRLASTPEAIYVDAAVQNLRELTEPFAQALDALAGGEVHLSRREREIANLIRAGKSSQEIAEALFVSPATVAFHRKNLRRKLGLPPRGPSLAAHLAGALGRGETSESPI